MENGRKYKSYRKKPYVVRWYENGRMRNQFFSTEQARAQFIDSCKQSSAGQDPSHPPIEAHKIIRWQQAAQIAPEADPVEVYRFWSATQTKRRNHAHRTLAQTIPPYVDAMERMQRHRSYIGHVRDALRDLLDELGDRDLRDFTSADLREHIFSLAYSEVTLSARPTYTLATSIKSIVKLPQPTKTINKVPHRTLTIKGRCCVP